MSGVETSTSPATSGLTITPRVIKHNGKCKKCNAWLRKGVCTPCFYREGKAEEERMLEVNDKLPEKARIGYI